jgi:hypothetical protein
MLLRGVLALATGSFAALPASAGEYLKPDQAKAFVAGKLFSYTCFEGTTGAGRIHADGSVIGTIRVRGSGPTRYVAFPPNTVRVKPNAICASVKGMFIEPCFNVEQIDSNHFRGSISGLGFAYCDFKKQSPRMQTAELPTSLLAPAASSTPVFRPHHHSKAVKSADATVTSSINATPVTDSDMKLRPSTRD